MDDIYEVIPILEGDSFLLRAVDLDRDLDDLLKVYSDEKAVPFFNSDNCHGDNFYYKTKERMKEAIIFWNREYTQKYYVRMIVEDKSTHTAIGMIELFNRKADDYFNNCGLLRLDLRSDYETEKHIADILAIIVSKTKEMFGCDRMDTKAIAAAKNRVSALKKIRVSVIGTCADRI